MNRCVVLLVLILSGLTSLATTDIAYAGVATSNLPTLVLKGKLETELAPHGQGNVYAPDVLLDGKLYRMWYGGQGKDGHDRIHYAESADGNTWIRKGVVIQDPSVNHVNDPSVVKVGSVYFMFYTRTKKDVVDRIDVAVSKDGTTWQPRGVALAAGPAGAWDSLSVGRPAVIYEEKTFKMWYDGRQNFGLHDPVTNVPKSANSKRYVGYATSEDGFHWKRHGPDPVFANNAGGVDVKRIGNQLIMLYESGNGTRYASSTDGINWSDRGLLAPKSGTKIDAFGHVTPFLLVDDDNNICRLYIGAAAAITWDHNTIAELKIPASRFPRASARQIHDAPMHRNGYIVPNSGG